MQEMASPVGSCVLLQAAPSCARIPANKYDAAVYHKKAYKFILPVLYNRRFDLVEKVESASTRSLDGHT